MAPSHLSDRPLAGGGQALPPAPSGAAGDQLKVVGRAKPALMRYRVVHDKRDEHQ